MTVSIPKLTVIVRTDLGSGPRVAQAVHGAHEFADAHPTIYAQWRRESNTVAILGAADEAHLVRLTEMAGAFDISHAIFREIDMGDAQTVLVLAPHPATRKVTAGLPLL